MFERRIRPRILDALSDTPAVLVHGARQVGKSTLVQEIATERAARYLTFDDAPTLAAASTDPDAFVDGLGGDAVVLDEVQRVPALFRALKRRIDRSRTSGQFLLTGSANILALPTMSDSLAGRMEVVPMWPLAEQEIEDVDANTVDRLFAHRFHPASPGEQGSVIPRLLRGGFPEVVARPSQPRRRAWYGSYVTTILQRDVRDLANIEGLAALPRMLALLATRASGLLNFASLAADLGIPQSTLKRYFALLEATYLVRLVPAWSTNAGLRFVKSPKVFLGDVGLCAHLLGADAARLEGDRGVLGPLLENLVAMELTKQSSWSETTPSLFHFRTHTGHEVDLVLEDAAGRIVGVEVKAAKSVTNADFKGLRALAEAAGRRFVRGVVLAMHEQPVSFGPELHAVPISALWTRAR